MAITTVSQHVVSVNAIQGTLIADNAITAVHIATNAVSGTLIADNAITATHIAQNVITVTQLADDAVEAAKIADGVITTNHLNKAMISSQTEVTAATGDFLLIGDTSDSNNLKKVPVSSILAGTLTTAAQTNITSLGTLTSLGVDGAAVFNDSGAAVDFRIEGDTEQNLFFVDGSADKIGIGTASPDAIFHSYQTAANYAAHFESANANSYGVWIEAGSSANDGYPLLSITDNGGSSTHFRVDSGTGRVGIGTASPLMRAHIKGATGDVPSNDSNAPANGILFLDSGGGYGMSLGTDDSNTGSAWIQSQNTSTSSTEYDLLLNPNGGNVGIGTTNAGYELHVEDDASETTIAVRSNVGGSGSAVGGRLRLQLGAQNNSGSGQADTQSGDILGQIMFEGQGTDYSYQGGNIKTIVTTGDGTATRSEQGTDMTFETIAVGSVSPTERMRIDSSGRVGINRTPAITNAKLEVGGADNVPLINVEASGATAGIGIGSSLMKFYYGTTQVMSITPSRGLNVGNTTGADANGIQTYVADNDIAIDCEGPGRVNFSINSDETGGNRWYFRTAGSGNFGSGNGDLLVLKEDGTQIMKWDLSSMTMVGDFDDTSDVGLKENITDITDATTKIKALKPRTFDWKDKNKTQGTNGFIAQEVETVLPKLVRGDNYDPENPHHGQKAINTSGLLAVAVKSIQELEARIKTLEDA